MAKRGRPPGSKNKPKSDSDSEPKTKKRAKRASKLSFVEALGVLGDSAEETLVDLRDYFVSAGQKETRPEFANVFTSPTSLIDNALKNVGVAIKSLGELLPEDFEPGYVPTKELTWEAGSFVVFKENLKNALGFKDAYEIHEVIELGKGPGNGTMIKLDVGVFPKGQLELIDPDGLEDADSNPVATAPVIDPKNVAPAPKASVPNGAAKTVVPTPSAILSTKQIEADPDDLNA